MAEYISREDYCQYQGCPKDGYKTCKNCSMASVPTADVRAVVRAEWKYYKNNGLKYVFKCTNCQHNLELTLGELNNDDMPPIDDYSFCSKCGANMYNHLIETEGKVLAVGLGGSFKDSLIKTEVDGLYLNLEE
ncbi:hypothetical protein [Ruminococcus flavefaciens]|uniref:hypothetical protein n=1 Tax=Ruminococcus flavefaciens TaxID=1265 RepID=UPI0026ED7671|nr:hypothetical protein [Ruminococcus flavefaciens]